MRVTHVCVSVCDLSPCGVCLSDSRVMSWALHWACLSPVTGLELYPNKLPWVCRADFESRPQPSTFDGTSHRNTNDSVSLTSHSSPPCMHFWCSDPWSELHWWAWPPVACKNYSFLYRVNLKASVHSDPLSLSFSIKKKENVFFLKKIKVLQKAVRKVKVTR